MHYIIDGNNLIYRTGLLDECSGDFEYARDALLTAISGFIGKNKTDRATIVYDVRSIPPRVSSNNASKVKVVYAVGPKEANPADKKIKTMASQEKNPYDVRVVSSDTGIMEDVRMMGITCIKSENFWNDNKL